MPTRSPRLRPEPCGHQGCDGSSAAPSATTSSITAAIYPLGSRAAPAGNPDIRWLIGSYSRRGGTSMGTGTKLSKDSAPQVESMPGFDGRYAREDGYVLGFESFDEAGDFTPMYE